jgi:hypothetical protein
VSIRAESSWFAIAERRAPLRRTFDLVPAKTGQSPVSTELAPRFAFRCPFVWTLNDSAWSSVEPRARVCCRYVVPRVQPRRAFSGLTPADPLTRVGVLVGDSGCDAGRSFHCVYARHEKSVSGTLGKCRPAGEDWRHRGRQLPVQLPILPSLPLAQLFDFFRLAFV